MSWLLSIGLHAWEILLDSSVYIIFGIVAAGLVKVFLDPSAVAHHLGRGRFLSVFKAALLGIPLPLCSCGVLPAAATLKKQGANNGATTAFLISTPESGVDSIALTYALLDPVMTVARPLAAAATALAAGTAENLAAKPTEIAPQAESFTLCPVGGCCQDGHCQTTSPQPQPGFFGKILGGMRYAFGELWGDLAGWFFVGVLLAGVISALLPPETLTSYLGGGIGSMLLMLVIGVPLYICATASTPIAAALILKGVSPGAALVFLLAGPATNLTSLTVLLGVLGKRATAIYLASIAVCAVLAGLVVDQVYSLLGISPQAIVGQAAEVVPAWAGWAGALLLVTISVRPVGQSLFNLITRRGHEDHDHAGHEHHEHVEHAEPAGTQCAKSTGNCS